MAVVALALVLASSASAHPEFAPTRTNRYVKVSLVGGGALRIAYTVLIGEVPAAAQRRLADANGDGAVSADEARAWADRLAAEVRKGLSLDVDGAPATVTWDPPVVGGFENPAVGPIPFSVDLIGHARAGRVEGQARQSGLLQGPPAHAVRYDDATPLPEVGDTEVRLEEGPGTKLTAAYRARDDGKLQTRFAFTGPKFSVIEDRSIGFRFTDGGTSPVRRRTPLPIALGGALVGAAVSVWLVARRRKR